MDTQLIPASTTYQEGLTAGERFEAYRYAAQPLCDAEPLRDRAEEDGE